MMAHNGVAMEYMYRAASLISMHVLLIKHVFIIIHDHVAPHIPSYFNAAPMHHGHTASSDFLSHPWEYGAGRVTDFRFSQPGLISTVSHPVYESTWL